MISQLDEKKRSGEQLASALQAFASVLIVHAGSLASKPHAIGIRKSVEVLLLTISASLAALVARRILLTTVATVGASTRHLLA